jgi:hypothetical protein
MIESSDIVPACICLGSSLIPQEIFPMQKAHTPYGSDVSAGTYECADCGRHYSNQSKTSLPPCPDFKPGTHLLKGWNILTGQGDAVEDPYPNQPSQ